MSGTGTAPARPEKQVHTRFRRGTVICPMCQANGRIEGTEHVTPLVKTLWVACTNVTCGMTWRMQLSFEFVVSPSAIEDPAIDLPLAPTDFRRKIYPPGPPGSAAAPDPNQFSMFADGDGDGGEGAEGEAEAA